MKALLSQAFLLGRLLGIITGMARLPSKLPESSAPDGLDRFRELTVAGLRAGHGVGGTARKLARGDKDRARRFRARIRRMLASDPGLQLMIHQAAQARMLEDALPVVDAVGQRAKRGRMDAAKVILEATGIHNPRVQHEHSGDIKISLDLPRPPAVADHGSAELMEEITDAEVVEE